MKIKFEIEADANGYSVIMTQDGKMIHQSKHERTDCGTKQISGDDEDDLPDGIRDAFPTFLGMELMYYAGAYND